MSEAQQSQLTKEQYQQALDYAKAKQLAEQEERERKQQTQQQTQNQNIIEYQRTEEPTRSEEIKTSQALASAQEQNLDIAYQRASQIYNDALEYYEPVYVPNAENKNYYTQTIQKYGKLSVENSQRLNEYYNQLKEDKAELDAQYRQGKISLEQYQTQLNALYNLVVDQEGEISIGSMESQRIREAQFTQQQRFLVSESGIKAIERAQEGYVTEQQRIEQQQYARDTLIQTLIIGENSESSPIIPSNEPVNLDTEGSLFVDTRTPEQRESDLLAGMNATENYIEGVIDATRMRAKEARVEAAEFKAEGDFTRTFLAYGGYTVGTLAAGAAEGATMLVRPKQLLGSAASVKELIVNPEYRSQAAQVVLADPGSVILEGIGNVIGGYAASKALGRLADFIEGKPGEVTRLKEIKVEQVPAETYIDEAGNVYPLGPEVKTRLTPKVEVIELKRGVVDLLEQDTDPIDTFYGFTKNKGYKTGYEIKVTPAEAEALLRGEIVETSFAKGASLTLDKVEFPDVYAIQRGQMYRSGGIQYFKEPAPFGPSIEGELRTIEYGNFKLRVTGAIEVVEEIPETQIYPRVSGEPTPWNTDVFPNGGDAAKVNNLIKDYKLPSKLGDVTKPVAELDVFAKPVEAARITPVASTFSESQYASMLNIAPKSTLFERSKERLDSTARIDSLSEADLASALAQVDLEVEALVSDQKPATRVGPKATPIETPILDVIVLPVVETIMEEKQRNKQKEEEKTQMIIRGIVPYQLSSANRKPLLIFADEKKKKKRGGGFRGRLEFTPAPTVEKIRKRLGL